MDLKPCPKWNLHVAWQFFLFNICSSTIFFKSYILCFYYFYFNLNNNKLRKKNIITSDIIYPPASNCIIIYYFYFYNWLVVLFQQNSCGALPNYYYTIKGIYKQNDWFWIKPNIKFLRFCKKYKKIP